MRETLFIPVDLDLPELLKQAGLNDLLTVARCDKLHYLIDRLYLGVVAMMYGWTSFVPINSQVLADVLGSRDAPKVKKALLDVGIIEVLRTKGREWYQPGERSKSYRFTKRFRKAPFHAVPIQNRRFKHLLERKRAARLARAIGDDSVRKLIADSIQKLDFDFDAASAFLDSTSFETDNVRIAYEYAVDSFRNREWLFVPDGQGRLYHNWSQMARRLRRFASYRGKPLWMADVSACQPCLLSLLYKEDCKEKEFYVDVVRNNRFYSFLNERLGTPFNLVNESEKKAFKQEVFHRVFYGSNRAKQTELREVFDSAFPTLSSLVRAAKRKHHRDLPVLLQSIEADIVINDVATGLATSFAASDMCLITVHDCIVTTEEYVYEVADRLKAAFAGRLGFVPNVKVARVTAQQIERPTVATRIVQSGKIPNQTSS